jgi:hypothetical protein
LRMNESIHDGDGDWKRSVHDGMNMSVHQMSESVTNDALHGNVLDMEWVQA